MITKKQWKSFLSELNSIKLKCVQSECKLLVEVNNRQYEVEMPFPEYGVLSVHSFGRITFDRIVTNNISISTLRKSFHIKSNAFNTKLQF